MNLSPKEEENSRGKWMVDLCWLLYGRAWSTSRRASLNSASPPGPDSIFSFPQTSCLYSGSSTMTSSNRRRKAENNVKHRNRQGARGGATDKQKVDGSDITLDVNVAITSHSENAAVASNEPRSRTPSPHTKINKKSKGRHIGVTLWKVLLSELNVNVDDSIEELENERDQGLANDSDSLRENVQLLLNYVKLPIHLEKFMAFGLMYSVVVFLKFLIILPCRWLIHAIFFIKRLVVGVDGNENCRRRQWSAKDMILFKNDTLLVSGILITLVLLRNLDTSRIYHNIRSGTAIKLYFMTQVLEIGDRLLSVSGQDILKVLYKVNSFSDVRKGKKVYNFKKIVHFSFLYTVSILYLWFHSYVLVYQVMALNVAINSYSNALMTLILSNQFSELKSAVFKKAEREGLFQISCSDLNERFLILIMLGIISSRNFLQILMNSTTTNDFFLNIKPNSWLTNLTPWKSFNNWIGLLIGPSIVVIGSEILVDWVKHAYIIRFNRIKALGYDKYTKILASDFVNGFTSDNFSKSNDHINDHPNLLTKRTGLSISTLMIVLCKLAIFPYVKYQVASIPYGDRYGGLWSIAIIFISLGSFIATLIFLRLFLSILLLQWSKKILQQPSSSSLGDYLPGSPNVSPSDISEVRKSLYNASETVPPSLEELRLRKVHRDGDDKLNNVVRYEMADKRIW